MKREGQIRLGAIACVLTSSVVVGCGGGDGGPTPVPTASPTPVATPTGQPSQTFEAPIALSSGQRGALILTLRGTQSSGTLRVGASTASTARVAPGSSSLFNFVIPAGVYTVSGTFSPPRGFRLAGTFPAPLGRFTIAGSIPTQALAGSVTVTANGQTATALIPALSTLPTPTPSPVGGTNLVFSSVSGANVTTTSIASIDSVPAAVLLEGTFGSSLTARLENGAATSPLHRSLGIQAIRANTSITSGASLPAVGASNVQNGVLIQLTESRSGGFTGTWRSSSGMVRFTSVGDRRATLQFENVTMVPNTPGEASATGSFRLSGPVTFSFQRTHGS